jgi:CHAT domain
LGLANQLAELNIRQMIVMREPVPDAVAKTFLKHFLTALACNNQSLYASVREARLRLEDFNEQYPGAKYLPVICQNSAVIPPTWEKLRTGGRIHAADWDVNPHLKREDVNAGRIGAGIWNFFFGRQAVATVGNPARPENQRILLAAVKEEVTARLKNSLHNAVLITNNQICAYLGSIEYIELWSTISSDIDLLELVKTPLLLSIAVLASKEISVEEWQCLTSTANRLLP